MRYRHIYITLHYIYCTVHYHFVADPLIKESHNHRLYYTHIFPIGLSDSKNNLLCTIYKSLPNYSNMRYAYCIDDGLVLKYT